MRRIAGKSNRNTRPTQTNRNPWPSWTIFLVLSSGVAACYGTPDTLPPSGSGGSAGSSAGTGGASGAAGVASGGASGGGRPSGGGGQAGLAVVGAGGGGTSGVAGLGGRGDAGGGVAGTGSTSAAGAAGAATNVTGAGGTNVTGAGGINAAGAGGTPNCSPACDANHACVSTRCLLVDGLSCTLASQCVSGVCSPFYVDQDGDGYGTGTAAGFCGTTVPVGYAAQSGDCCDSATNIAVAKLIHPNADFQPTSAGGVCNITWDYNCSGIVEKPSQTCASCTAAPDCQCMFQEYPDTSCGKTVAGYGCSAQSAGSAVQCIYNAGGTFVLGCR